MSALLALLSSLLWGAADFAGGTATRRLPASTVVLTSQAVALLGLVPLALLLDPADAGRAVLPGVLAGVVGPTALAAFYRALALGTMGVVAPVAALGVAVPVAAGLATGESPRAVQLLGIGVAVLGVVLACGPELRGGRAEALPVLLAGASALGFGLVFVLLALGSSGAGAGPADVVRVLLVMRATSVALLLVVAAATRGRRTGGWLRPADLPVLALIGVFDVGANGTFALAAQSDLVSVTAVLASLYPVVTALLAWQVHGERLARRQLVGVVVALLGVLLLAGG